MNLVMNRPCFVRAFEVFHGESGSALDGGVRWLSLCWFFSRSRVSEGPEARSLSPLAGAGSASSGKKEPTGRSLAYSPVTALAPVKHHTKRMRRKLSRSREK